MLSLVGRLIKNIEAQLIRGGGAILPIWENSVRTQQKQFQLQQFRRFSMSGLIRFVHMTYGIQL